MLNLCILYPSKPLTGVFDIMASRTEIYADYATRAANVGVTPKSNTSFQNKQAILDAIAALPKPTRAISTMQLSGTTGYIHDKLDPAQRARARRWIAALDGKCGVAHEYRGSWSTSVVPVELCAALGVTCHPEPRS